MTGGVLEPGRYDAVVDRRLAERLRGVDPDSRQVSPIEDADAPQRLTRQLADALGLHLARLDPAERIAAVNALIAQLDDPDAAIDDPLRALQSIAIPPVSHAPAPDIPLSQHDLLVHARGEPHLAAELKKEIASANEIDLIVAFVRWYGVRLIHQELAAAVQRGAHVRLLTTTYTGSTEALALDRLRELGVNIRVSYDTQITRLHAKCWIFHRRSGFSTAYVGSSNLTHSAMTDGREWNVRLSRTANAALFDKVAGAFESQWSSPDYEEYDRDRFTIATAVDRVRNGDDPTQLSGLELRPWPYQDEILDALTVERDVHGHTRNLVVAPTGTGKTVVAALDYTRLRREHGDLRLLFVAHREQILRQSRRTFREALGDGAFGELLVGGHRPTEGRHVFASIQTLASPAAAGAIGDDFDVVIVDEFHHAEARTYERLLERLRCRWLLALTATPERSDGLDIRRWTDGRTAFDMRLWHALDRELLAPFQYFGLADVADLSHVSWHAGQYERSELGKLFTGNDARDRLVVRQVERIIGDPRAMRALGFCATVDHARHMARVFTRAGWPAAAVDGTTPQAERQHHVDRLVSGELTTIFTRDVFNEGIDIPQVDTILLLRPTESVTVHLQQIGRGLRRHHDKPVCTILDLVGQHRREYRYDMRLRALTGVPRKQLAAAAESGFPYLPSGCHLELDRQAREWVIAHLKESVAANRPALRRELQIAISERADATAPMLEEFLEHSGADLEDVIKIGWSGLKRDVGCDVPPPGPDEQRLTSGLRRVLHLDDAERIDGIADWLTGDHPPLLDAAGDLDRRRAWMFLVTIWGLRNAPDSIDAAWRRLWECPAILADLRECLPLIRERIARPSLPLPDVPLRLHASYARDELLAAFGYVTEEARPNLQTGRWFDEATRTELLFVTLQKTEKSYSPTTMYRDYAISRDLFHWESPNTTTPQSPLGLRYTDQAALGVRILLAVRQHKNDPWGATAPYTLLGPAHVERWEGRRPMSVTMRLDNPIPADLYEEFKLAAA